MKRLLILEDRKKDAELLIQRPVIKKYFQSSNTASEPIYVCNMESVGSDEIKNTSIVIAQTLEAGLEIIERGKFDLIISDLLLFDPRKVNAILEQDYFAQLPLEERRRQITRPSGLQFIKQLRLEDRGTGGTPRDVPIIAMTFFWRHPRFEALYVRQIRSVSEPAVGYLPKYYWVGNTGILDKGDDALRVLIKLLDKADDELNRELMPMLFDAVALDLFVYQNRFDLHDALQALRTSYHDSCRSIVEFELMFNFGSIRKPEESADFFDYVMEKLNEEDIAENVAIEVKFHNVPTATKVLSTGKRKERALKHPDKGKLLTMHARGERSTAREAKFRRFGICWALALYTYPLAQGPHCLSGGALADLLSAKLGGNITEKTIKSDINSIRHDLQGMLPDGIREFVSAENHLIVTHGKDGYYLNGTYNEHWER